MTKKGKLCERKKAATQEPADVEELKGADNSN